MAEIIDISTKAPIPVTETDTSIINELIGILEQHTDLSGFLITIKEPNDDLILYRSNNLNLKDRSFIVQLMQSDINDDMVPTYEHTDAEDDDDL